MAKKSNSIFERYEKKYMLDRETYNLLLEAIEPYMRMDSYGKHTIGNIYYDTNTYELIRHSIEKPVYKEKLRLRSYGVPNLDSKVYLEIKKKFDGIVNKRRTALSLSEAYEFLLSKVPPKPKEYMNTQVLREIEYFLKIYNLSPKLYLAYDRIAFFEKGNKDLRISFDMNIRTRRHD